MVSEEHKMLYTINKTVLFFLLTQIVTSISCQFTVSESMQLLIV